MTRESKRAGGLAGSTSVSMVGGGALCVWSGGEQRRALRYTVTRSTSALPRALVVAVDLELATLDQRRDVPRVRPEDLVGRRVVVLGVVDGSLCAHTSVAVPVTNVSFAFAGTCALGARPMKTNENMNNTNE